MKTAKSGPLKSPPMMSKERPRSLSPSPDVTPPVIGAVTIQGQLWPSVGAKRFGTEIPLDCCALRLSLHIGHLHIGDPGPPTVIHMNMLDADNLMSAVTQASENLYLRRIRLHQTSRSRPERCNSPFRCEGARTAMAAACVQAIWRASAPSISSIGAAASIIASAACDPVDDTHRISTVPGFARHRMVAGPMVTVARTFVRHRGVLTDARLASSQAAGLRDQCPCDHSFRPRNVVRDGDEDQGENPSRGPRGSSVNRDGGGNLRADPPSRAHGPTNAGECVVSERAPCSSPPCCC